MSEENKPSVIVSFLSYKGTIQNCSELTVNEYYSDLRTFFRYLIASRNGMDMSDLKKVDISGIDAETAASVEVEEVYSFLLFTKSVLKNNEKTRARKLSALRAFYKYHTSKAHTFTENPTKDIDSPNVKQSLPKFLTLEESLELLRTAGEPSTHGIRDYAILTLFLNCGMRLSELVGINLSSITPDLTRLTVVGKGNKMRVIYLNEACRDALKAYFKAREAEFSEGGIPIKDRNALFLSRLGRRISTKTVQWTVKKYLKMSGLDGKGYSTHKLRHTAATLMYNQGKVDVRVLQDVLGHEQLNTTQIYTHLTDNRIAEAMDANPLSEVKRGRKKIE